MELEFSAGFSLLFGWHYERRGRTWWRIGERRSDDGRNIFNFFNSCSYSGRFATTTVSSSQPAMQAMRERIGLVGKPRSAERRRFVRASARKRSAAISLLSEIDNTCSREEHHLDLCI